MYIQNENKALAQYQRSDEVPYTFAYMGYKQEYYPRGTVAITFKVGIWVTKIPACMETCTLMNKLVRFIMDTGAAVPSLFFAAYFASIDEIFSAIVFSLLWH